MVLFLIPSIVKAQSYTFFSAENEDGVTIYYYANESTKTCSVTYVSVSSVFSGGNPAINVYYSDYKGDVVIPSSVNGFTVTSIRAHAFSNSTDLSSVTIPNSVKSISESAFEDCTSLTSVTIPNSVTSISRLAFEGCTSLPSITIPNSVTSISDDTFLGCTNLTSVTIPSSVTSISNGAFRGCI